MARVKTKLGYTTPTVRRKLLRELRERLDLTRSLDSLIEVMHRYEEKYDMSTVEFYARYVAGKMGDSRDVMRWAGAFEDYQAILREHFGLAAA